MAVTSTADCDTEHRAGAPDRGQGFVRHSSLEGLGALDFAGHDQVVEAGLGDEPRLKVQALSKVRTA